MKPKRTLTHTLALAVMMASNAWAALPAPMPKFMDANELADWRAEMAEQVAEKDAAQAKADALAAEQSFFTGKPYLPATGSYAFKYRSYQPEIARWTSEDPSGFPDGANNGIYVNNKVLSWLDDTGLAGRLVIHSSRTGNSSVSAINGHSWISYTRDGGARTTYGTWGNNPRGGPNGLYTDLELNRDDDEATRSTHLDDVEENRLYNEIESYINMAEDAWSYSHPCSGFASNVWSVITGEDLDPGFPNTPTNLINTIIEANGGENHGFLE